MAITYSSCTFPLLSELSSSIVEGGLGCVVGLSNKAKFVPVTCVEEMSLLGLTYCFGRAVAVVISRQVRLVTFCDTVQSSPIRSGRALRTRVVCPLPWTSHDVRWHFVDSVLSTD